MDNIRPRLNNAWIQEFENRNELSFASVVEFEKKLAKKTET